MAEYSELEAEISGMSDVVGGVVRVIDGLIEDIEGNITSPAAIQGSLEKIRVFKQQLAEAVAKGTAADPDTEVEEDNGEQELPLGEETQSSTDGTDLFTGEGSVNPNKTDPEGTNAPGSASKAKKL